MNLSLLNWLEVRHSHWTDTAKLGAVIPPTGSPGGQSRRFCFSLRPVHFSAMISKAHYCCFCASLGRFLLRGLPSGVKIALPAPVLGKECAGELLAGV